MNPMYSLHLKHTRFTQGYIFLHKIETFPQPKFESQNFSALIIGAAEIFYAFTTNKFNSFHKRGILFSLLWVRNKSSIFMRMFTDQLSHSSLSSQEGWVGIRQKFQSLQTWLSQGEQGCFKECKNILHEILNKER